MRQQLAPPGACWQLYTCQLATSSAFEWQQLLLTRLRVALLQGASVCQRSPDVPSRHLGSTTTIALFAEVPAVITQPVLLQGSLFCSRAACCPQTICRSLQTICGLAARVTSALIFDFLGLAWPCLALFRSLFESFGRVGC